ncbi:MULTISPECIES: hypothetical protein [unclassified Bacillus (in: firmicutes)]|uniref:hypothetical protein n=1 Tax=unclassified Bacillus (in: firmicutes) TaxID=185979 RepID=UPI0008F1F47C|nr:MULTISPECIES: hypothetical protein [unclassified Bacillus (in: firmicutes)]SFA80420.1 hypothetical protein SAMN02799634_101937 [Bacillus sp. UNCCL13]SFQ70483.1 hypothetical protein SAMN04488577_1212 [Bacillus sp. cl95]
MDANFSQLANTVGEIKNLMDSFQDTLVNIEKRLSRLEKMDSIEHRVEVNQIDLSDIKEAILRMEDHQNEEIGKVLQVMKESFTKEHNETIMHINRRLDSHLIKLAKAEEEIIILKNR